jgi:diguanylate cyclase (GGDEF)-like protein/PAS domain S-box-containing protein
MSSPETSSRMRSGAPSRRRTITVVMVYAIFSALWILLSDRAVDWLFRDPGLILLASTLKGWVFVAVTSALLYLMMRRKSPAEETAAEESRQLPAAVFALLAAAITALVILAVWNGLREEKEKAYAQLLAISESKSREIETWLKERLSDASWAHRSPYLRQQWLQWRERGDAAAHLRLQQFLGTFVRDSAFPRMEIVDAQGRRIFDSNNPDLLPRRVEDAPFVDPALHVEVLRALTLSEPRRAGPWRDAQGRLRLAFVGPVAGDTAYPATLVLHIDPQDYLHPALTDLDARIEYVNHAFELCSGYTRAEVQGKNPRLLRSEHTPPEVFASMWFTLSAGQAWHGEMINRARNGREYVQSMNVAPVRDIQGQITHYLAVQLDVTAQKDAEDKAHQLAWFNTLTGLPNRHRALLDIQDALQAHARTGEHCALLLLNLDRFQTVNDALGHAAGDQLLIQVGTRLAGLLHADDRLAHLSADEFAILLHAGNSADHTGASTQALRLAQALHEQFDTPFRLERGEALNVSCCIGITLLPQGDDDSPGDVLRRADTALHRAKDGGARQTAFFDVSMEQLISRRFLIEHDLRRGLAAEELRLYLQPQVNAQGHVVGAEALVRWLHPEHGLMSPANFIPIAEESELITEVGRWVLQSVCRHLGDLRGCGLRLPIAVNISPRQFHQPGFVHMVQDILQAHNAAPDDLVIEITESIVMDQMENVVQKMSHLTSLGVKFSLDDFGTGYSSLAYLKRLPIHELKIDRSFVQDAPTDPSDAALVEAILSVARHLRLKVVAEGVETTEQAEFLNARGQVIQQGYLHGRPAPAEEVLARWRSSMGSR